MAQFKIVRADGTEHRVSAQRLVTDGHHLRFEDKAPETWITVDEHAATDVDRVLRQITEFNGTRRWISERLPGRTRS